MGGACSTNKGVRNTYKLLARKSEGKRLLGRPSHRWEDNNRNDPREIVL